MITSPADAKRQEDIRKEIRKIENKPQADRDSIRRLGRLRLELKNLVWRSNSDRKFC